MTLTATDLFCGAGGSSLGARAAGVELVVAANHWQTAIDVHQAHFPEARHDVADISAADPRRYPRTDILMASPECTNHSQAKGISRKKQNPTLWDAPDPAAERSRATMWDVPRFAEQMHYEAIVVENVVEATKWVGWRAWCTYLDDVGYAFKVLSINAQDHGVPQSRDRIYVVCWRKGAPAPDLEMERQAWCPRCDLVVTVRQAWKNGRTIGRYRQQWVWACTTCGTTCDPEVRPAADIIDWALPCPTIGERNKPLAKATRERILAGLIRHGWVPVVTAGAGNTHERTPGNRAHPLTDPLPVQQATATNALAAPPGFLFQTAHGGRVVPFDGPHPTVCASDDRLALVLSNNHENVPQDVDDPLSTVTTGNRHALLIPLRRNGHAHPPSEPLATVTAGGMHHGLLMRNNGGGAEMVTSLDEPARTMTTAGHQSLLVPYNGKGQAKPTGEPLGTQPATDRWALVDPDQVIDECGFRMLEPHEIAAAMAFPEGYIPEHLTKKAQVKLAGNANCPPNEEWILGRVAHALEHAS